MEDMKGTLFHKIQDCLNDEDLEKFIVGEEIKKEYNQIINTIPNRQDGNNSIKILTRLRQKLKSVIVFDSISKYKQATSHYRQLNSHFVCYIDEWPAQAILNIGGVNISDAYKGNEIDKEK